MSGKLTVSALNTKVLVIEAGEPINFVYACPEQVNEANVVGALGVTVDTLLKKLRAKLAEQGRHLEASLTSDPNALAARALEYARQLDLDKIEIMLP